MVKEITAFAKSSTLAAYIILITSCAGGKGSSTGLDPAIWEVTNGASFGIIVSWSGPSNGTVELKANEKKAVIMAPGEYSVKVTASYSGFRYVSEKKSFQSGENYSDTYLKQTGPKPSEDPSTVQYKGVKYFASASPPPEISNREYKTQFSRSFSHYIYIEVNLKNLLHGIRDNTVNMKASLYGPDGKLVETINLTYTLTSSLGADVLIWNRTETTTGNWRTGTYRVEIYISGKKVGDSTYSIF
jgi:hypothetical protein